MTVSRVKRQFAAKSNEFAMTESDHFTSSALRDVVALGKKYAKTSCPNPNRDGCPSRSSLRAMAYRDRGLTLRDLPASHVVSCSPCFQEYSHFRRMRLFVRGLQVTGATLGLAAIAFIGRLVWHHDLRCAEQTISAKLLPMRHGTANSTDLAPPVAPLPRTVDLAVFSPSRGDGNEPAKKVHLPQKLLRATLLLPLGLDAGEYEIRLENSVGTATLSKHAVGLVRGDDGITSVELEMDLAKTTRGNFSLMIRPPGSAWRTYPVVVE
jgi:hypothetical protein